MRKIGVCLAIVVLTAAACLSAPAAAFSVRVGPYHFVFIPYGHRHHRHHAQARRPPSHPAPSETAPPAPAQQSPSSALLYPPQTLPAVYDLVFGSDDASAWPFDYRAIMLAGFSKAPANARLCQAPDDQAGAIAAEISDAVAPNGEQLRELQNLERALAAAASTLAQTCPSELPASPAARLQLMASQIGRVIAALDTVRQPLNDFQRSLNDEQRARLAAMIVPPPGGGSGRARCGASGDAVETSMDQIEHAVVPTDEERNALADLKQALGAAANELAAHCPAALPPTPSSRLAAVTIDLGAARQAVASIRTALADFEGKLSDEQKARLDAIDFGGR